MSDLHIKDLQARLEKLEQQVENMKPFLVRAAVKNMFGIVHTRDMENRLITIESKLPPEPNNATFNLRKN